MLADSSCPPVFRIVSIDRAFGSPVIGCAIRDALEVLVDRLPVPAVPTAKLDREGKAAVKDLALELRLAQAAIIGGHRARHHGGPKEDALEAGGSGHAILSIWIIPTREPSPVACYHRH